MNNIHSSMDKQIRKWFEKVLLDYCKGHYSDYTEISDIIDEQMVQSFMLSVNELLVCNEMSVKDIITANRIYKNELLKFKNEVKLYAEAIIDII